MRTYNLLPKKIMPLPTNELEALQAGADTYVHLAGLLALTGRATLTLDGRHLTPASDRLSDLLTYVDDAHPYLHRLPTIHHLVALA
jgi:hypothetical protein